MTAAKARPIPLVIAVTGHRDLVSSEIAGIRDQVRAFFLKLRASYPDRPLRLMSPLAEGGDRLVAECALELGIELTVPLPMKKQLYLQDFDTPESREHFETLCASASEIFALPLTRGVTEGQISSVGPARSRQYAQLGVFLCAHCHILLALWDGKWSDELGGTGQVVKFHHDDVIPGYTSRRFATQQMLVDDESDLVYHIVCSRDRHDGAPLEGLQPLDSFWFIRDGDQPRTAEIPKRHKLIFERSGDFSNDSIRFADEIEKNKYPLFDPQQRGSLPPGVEDIDRLFCIADCLAIRYQKKTLFTLRVSHILAFLMGLMFILYMDFENWPYFMVTFLVFFLFAAGLQTWSQRRGWHRKYLDYRTLAEGLRVQFYWAVAGVVKENVSKFAHDNFLQTQDTELGWIRNVMRVAGTRCDVRPAKTAEGLDFVQREWIGDTSSGQLGYFGNKAIDRIARNQLTERLGKLSLLTSVTVVLSFVVMGSSMPDAWVSPLTLTMGTLLLLYGIRQGYGYATAEKDLIKQYQFMHRIFKNARRRLDQTDDPIEHRLILQALGGSALDEHAEWLLMHRDRSIDQGEIWRMGS